MALPLTNNDPTATVAPLATIGDWLTFWLPTRALPGLRLALARRHLQRQARRQLSRGECGMLAGLVAAGNWDAMDRLCDALEATA
jgi:hypothetical protein